MNKSNPYSSPIRMKRARDFYLYDMHGKRYVDCSICSNNALLGHKPNNMSKTIKQTLDLGLWGMDNGREASRVIKHLNTYIQGWNVSHIISVHNADMVSHHTIFQNTDTDIGTGTISDLLFETDLTRHYDTCIWRAFSPIKRDTLSHLNARYLLTPLPLPWKNPLFAVYTKEEVPEVYIEISEVLLAGINYIIPYLIEKGTEQRPPCNIAKNRKDIFIIDTSVSHNHRFQSHTLTLPQSWTKKNIYYILPDYDTADYNRVQNIFLERGFFFPKINITPPRIIVLPPYMTRHEIDKWEDACNTL